MALRFYLHNRSIGEFRSFRLGTPMDDRTLFDDENPKDTTPMSWLKANYPDIASIVREEDIMCVDGDAGHPLTTRIDTVEDVREFLDRRTADAEWSIPEGMLYVDWLECMNIICTDIDPEAVTYDKKEITVTDYDPYFIDCACESLRREGRHLTCYKHVYKDYLERVFEDEVIQ